MEDFLDEINSSTVPSEELKCGEYCFHRYVNPFQHPYLDRNIYHLTTLLTALNNTCGGVVYLNTPMPIGLEESLGQFNLFTSRLFSLPDVQESLIEISQVRENTSWAVIAARKCHESLSCNFDNSYVKIWLDIHGKLLQEKCNHNVEGQEVLKNPDVALEGDEAPETVSKGMTGVDGATPSKIPKLNTAVKDDQSETVQLPVDFSTVHELNWDKNKKNWEGILRETKQLPEDVINLCDIWQPQLPMLMTPSRDSLNHLFPTDTECKETICKLETKSPGFGIANRSWASLFPKLRNLQRPPNHLCDILTVAEGEAQEPPQPSVRLWVIVSNSSHQTIPKQVEYMFVVGRILKYQLSRQDRYMPNLAIRCMLHSTRVEDNARIEHTLHKLGIQNIYDFVCSVFNDKHTFDCTKRSIALLLLSQESPIKTSVGDQLSVKLSAKQAQTLLEIKSRKVSYISSPPGTGKTLCGLALYRDFGKERSVYISPTEPLLYYLRHNGCEATLVKNDEELYRHIKCGTFDNKMCVIIDESHRLKCSMACLMDLFVLMKKHRMRLFVFADYTYQSFDKENQQNIQQYIRELSSKVWERPPYEPIFTEIFRNTRKVVSFLQHAIEDPDSDSEDVLDITCVNAHEGDGIQCVAMENPSENHSDNGLVQYLLPLLDTRYQVTDVAVLLDDSYTDDDIDAIRQILQTYIPRVTTHSATVYPRQGIIVDRLERFAGLDAALCIFLLSVGRATNRDATIENPRYRVYLASRATHKAIFVVPRIAADVVQQMKFDHFQVGSIHVNMVVTSIISVPKQ